MAAASASYIPESHRPDEHGQELLNRVDNQFGEFKRLARRRQKPWMTPLRDLLVSHNLESRVADAMVMILFNWADLADDAAERHAQLDALFRQVRYGSVPLERLTTFVHTFLPEDHAKLFHELMKLRVA